MPQVSKRLKIRLLAQGAQAGCLVLLSFFAGAMFMPDGKAGPALPAVDIEAVRAASALGDPVLLDARNAASFAVNHIPKAINLPSGAPEAEVKAAAKYPQIIVYCSDAACPDSKKLAARLVAAGATGVALYPGGWEEWSIAEGL